jgi:cell division protein FtsI (penicillin-binding protein 3)
VTEQDSNQVVAECVSTEPADAAGVLDLAWRTTIRRRLGVAAIAFTLWSVGIEARLVYLQVMQHDELVARAERQQLRTIETPPKRGAILDRRGRVLAYSVEADSIYAVPTEVANADRAATELCRVLEDCSARDRDAMAERLRRDRQFVYIRRFVSPDEAKRVANLGLAGIGFLKEDRRYYPKRELAAHVVGYAGIDNVGLAGVESAFDDQIRGEPGTLLIQTDARRHAFSRLERPPTTGATVELTVDEYLQYIAERELRAAVAEHRALGGTVIIMDPHTGALLAMANEPGFNPNMFGRSSADVRRNRGVQDIYEPGSTFKIVTASAALEENVMSVDEPIDVSAGLIRFGSRTIEDVHTYGVLSFTDVIVKSSNVGAIKVGMKLGPDRLGRYVRRFGFGQTLSRQFPGESAGIVWDPSRWSPSALASVSMGYQIGVTPLQMAAAVSSIANGGELLEPRIVGAVIRHGRRVETPRRVIRRTVTPETAERLTSIMEAVVDRGTAKAAALEGFTVAGKTGTAAKLVGGRYSQSQYNASFVGFVPSRDPIFTILVVIDSPRAGGYYGGAVAAPVFARVADAALRQADAVPSAPVTPPVVVVHHQGAQPLAPLRVRTAAAASLDVSVDARDVMPELRGLSAREALRILARFGIGARVTGDGLVVEQVPAAGAAIGRGEICNLRLSRQLVAAGPAQ